MQCSISTLLPENIPEKDGLIASELNVDGGLDDIDVLVKKVNCRGSLLSDPLAR